VEHAFLFSLEFELALGTDDALGPLDRNLAYRLLLHELRSLVPCLPDGGNGLFTPGFRFYLDAGDHPEMALVETASPWQLLELKQASFALLNQAVQRVRRIVPGLVVLVNNHDYVAPAYWGCHENYAIRLHPIALLQGMIPFLATRHLLAGNGRIDPRGRVLLSARAPAMVQVTGGSTTCNRALFSTCRHEPLMSRGPFVHRLHLICGDSLASQTGEFLKVSTTALVVTWLEHNPHGADDLRHPYPLRLLKSSNIIWRPTGRLQISETALAIQQTYCDRIARFVESEPRLPAWCALAATRWSQTLSLLRHDPLALADRLDPFIKLTLFDAALQTLGRRWSEIAADRGLYQRLALLDLAYQRTAGDGPFVQLEREGRLQHRLIDDCGTGLKLPEQQDIGSQILELARRLPTRAGPRARLIASLCGEGEGIHCNWNVVSRTSPPGGYDLNDPTLTDLPPWEPAGGLDPSPGTEARNPARDRTPDDSSARPDEREARRMLSLARLRRLIAEHQPGSP
jgi:hypothetical protein